MTLQNKDSQEQIIEQVLSSYENPGLRSWLRLKTKVGQLPTTLFLPLFEGWEPKAILEIGCGYGVLSSCLSLHYPQSRVQGIDIDAKRISGAQQSAHNKGNLKFALQNALDMSGEEWDCLILVDMLHHVPRHLQEKIVIKCHELLKPGGRLLIREVDPEANLGKFWLTHIFECVFYQEVCKMLSISQLSGFMSKAGFKQIDVHRDNPKSPVFPYVTYMAYR